jgi:hypothetical protein
MTYLWTNVVTDLAATPEMHLIGAILHQAVQDTQSPRRDVREAAVAFWSNPDHVRWWEDFLGVPDGVLQQQVHTILREGC